MANRGIIASVSVVAVAFAQQAGTRPEFAVGSVRPSNSEGRPEVGNSNGRSHGKNATLRSLMSTAYQVPVFQISGGPRWVDSDRFDIEARAEDPKTGYIQLRLMMQSLLEDRFRLKLHRETRESSVYLLVPTRGKPKMTPSEDQTSPDATGTPSSPTDGPVRGSVLIGRGLLVANAAPISLLAKMLASELGRPVLDQTNLSGRFDIRLSWTPEALRDSAGPDGAGGPDATSLACSLRSASSWALQSNPPEGPWSFW
jgi:uncharacterized protein (TIGR03435 family)